MTTLTLDKVPAPIEEFEPVEVPEFGTDEDGDPYSVNVRGMTVHEWSLLLRKAFRIEQNGGEPTYDIPDDYDEHCLVAAICSYDDESRLVFGVDVEDATKRLMRLPRRYRPALRRIHAKALELSGRSESERSSVEEAEKN